MCCAVLCLGNCHCRSLGLDCPAWGSPSVVVEGAVFFFFGVRQASRSHPLSIPATPLMSACAPILLYLPLLQPVFAHAHPKYCRSSPTHDISSPPGGSFPHPALSPRFTHHQLPLFRLSLLSLSLSTSTLLLLTSSFQNTALLTSSHLRHLHCRILPHLFRISWRLALLEAIEGSQWRGAELRSGRSRSSAFNPRRERAREEARATSRKRE